MPERLLLNNTEMIELAQEVAVRHVTTIERGSSILKLATLVRLQLVWRTTIYSHDAAASVWQFLGDNGVDMEALIAMTGEFLLRMEQTPIEQLGELLARTVAWPQGATAIPKPMNVLTGTVGQYTSVFNANPWLAFLYLLSLSDIIQYLDAKLPKGTQTVPRGLRKEGDNP